MDLKKNNRLVIIVSDVSTASVTMLIKSKRVKTIRSFKVNSKLVDLLLRKNKNQFNFLRK